jgi:O-antigen/teichoic acid export membrane protein
MNEPPPARQQTGRMNFGRNVIASGIAMAMTATVGLVSLGLIARQLGPDQFGKVALLLAIFNFFIFFDGTRAVIVKLWHSHSENRPAIAGGSLIIAAAFAVLLFAFSVLSIRLLFDFFSPLSAMALGAAIATHMPLAVFWGILDANERVGFTALLRAFAWSATYIAFVGYGWFQLPLETYALSLALMNLFLAVTMALSVRRSGCRFCLPESGIAKTLLSNSMRMMSFNFLSAAVTAWDRLVLALLMPLGMLGIYSLQVELGIRGRMLVNGFSRVMYPRLARQLEEQELRTIIMRWLPYLRLLVTGIVLVALAISSWARPLLTIYAGAPFAEHDFILKAVMAMLPINAAGILAMTTQRASLDFRSQPRAYAIALILGMLAVYPAVTAYGLVGATAVYCLLRTGDLILVLSVARRLMHSGRSRLLLVFISYAAMFGLQLANRTGWSWLVAVVFFMLILDLRSISLLTRFRGPHAITNGAEQIRGDGGTPE